MSCPSVLLAVPLAPSHWSYRCHTLLTVPPSYPAGCRACPKYPANHCVGLASLAGPRVLPRLSCPRPHHAGRTSDPSCCSHLVKLPTPPSGEFLNGNHKQLRGGKENAAHQETTNLMYTITCPEIGFTDRPRDTNSLVVNCSGAFSKKKRVSVGNARAARRAR